MKRSLHQEGDLSFIPYLRQTSDFSKRELSYTVSGMGKKLQNDFFQICHHWKLKTGPHLWAEIWRLLTCPCPTTLANRIIKAGQSVMERENHHINVPEAYFWEITKPTYGKVPLI
ncbi:hypothetical protein BsWGS_21738 [Bradybaena similaris]